MRDKLPTSRKVRQTSCRYVEVGRAWCSEVRSGSRQPRPWLVTGVSISGDNCLQDLSCVATIRANVAGRGGSDGSGRVAWIPEGDKSSSDPSRQTGPCLKFPASSKHEIDIMRLFVHSS